MCCHTHEMHSEGVIYLFFTFLYQCHAGMSALLQSRASECLKIYIQTCGGQATRSGAIEYMLRNTKREGLRPLKGDLFRRLCEKVIEDSGLTHKFVQPQPAPVNAHTPNVNAHTSSVNAHTPSTSAEEWETRRRHNVPPSTDMMPRNLKKEREAGLKEATKETGSGRWMCTPKASTGFSGMCGMGWLADWLRPCLSFNGWIPQGILITGDSGVGKTAAGLAMSHALPAHVNFIRIKSTDLLSMTKPEDELRDLFATIRENSPCLAFFDDLDAVYPAVAKAAKKEEQNKGQKMHIQAQILAEYIAGHNDALFVASAATVASLDSCLLTPEVFTSIPIALKAPSRDMRGQLLKHFVAARGAVFTEQAEKDVMTLLLRAVGWSPRDIKQLVYSAYDHAMTREGNVQGDMETATGDMKTATGDMETEVNTTKGDMDDAGTSEDSTTISDSEADGTVPDDCVCTGECVDLSIDDGEKETGERTKERAERTKGATGREVAVELRSEDMEWSWRNLSSQFVREGFSDIPNVCIDQVGGLEFEKDFVKSVIVDGIVYAKRFRTLALDDPSGILLWGPPGCGKTLLAQAIANACHAKFIFLRGSELLNKYVGESELQVRQTFERARANAPCLIFFDEFDAICPRRDQEESNEVAKRVVSSILVEMDSVSDRRGVFIVATTNNPDMIDPAMLRGGRLEHCVFVGPPDLSGRKDIIERIVKYRPAWRMSSDLPQLIAERTEGFTGADLKLLLTNIARNRIHKILDDHQVSHVELTIQDVEEELNDITPAINDIEMQRYNQVNPCTHLIMHAHI